MLEQPLKHIVMMPFIQRNEEKLLIPQDFVPVTEQPVAKNFSINNMVMEERMRQGQPPPWHEQDEIDSTRVSTVVVCVKCKPSQHLQAIFTRGAGMV